MFVEDIFVENTCFRFPFIAFIGEYVFLVCLFQYSLQLLVKNAGERTGRVEINKEEIPGSKRSMYGYILTYSSL